MTDILLRTESLGKEFIRTSGLLGRRVETTRAVEDVTLEVRRGESFGLVGESGSGKTTLGKLILRLLDPSTGRVWIDGQDVTTVAGAGLFQMRGRAQMVFQDPYSSLNPRMTVRELVGEPLVVHRGLKGEPLEREVVRLLEMVQLNPAQADRRPHEFSGGQRQRIGIARALALEPELLVLDEPTSALDVSVQAQVVQLLDRLRRDLRLTYVFISHDLALVSLLCDRIGVMYLGQLVEVAPSAELFREPRHPYTRALLASVPRLEPGSLDAPPVGEARPDPGVAGCRFFPRCPARMPGTCDALMPLLAGDGPGRQVACHLYDAAGKAGAA